MKDGKMRKRVRYGRREVLEVLRLTQYDVYLHYGQNSDHSRAIERGVHQ